jgi:hypothetical protein
MEIQLPVFLTSALDGGEWSASSTGRFTPGERITGTHWIRDCVAPRAGLDVMKKRQILLLSGIELRFFGSPARSPPLFRLYYIQLYMVLKSEMHIITKADESLNSAPGDQKLHSFPIEGAQIFQNLVTINNMIFFQKL